MSQEYITNNYDSSIYVYLSHAVHENECSLEIIIDRCEKLISLELSIRRCDDINPLNIKNLLGYPVDGLGYVSFRSGHGGCSHSVNAFTGDPIN